MSSTSSASGTRKLSTVYVQVPPPPFDLDRYQPLSGRHVPASSTPHSTNRKLSKENTKPPRTHMSQSASTTSSSSAKRKLADGGDSASDVAPPSSKKIKSASTGTPLKPTQVNSSVDSHYPSANACPEFPNGWIYCHQCCKKRDVTATIQCTYMESKQMAKSKSVKEWRCVAKYCKACLQNRYGEDMDTIKCNKRRESGHFDNAGYYFKCPKCKDDCNCPRCRKAKGLEPIGTMKKSGEAEKVSTTSKKEKASAKKENTSSSAPPQPKKRAQPKPKPKPKILPAVKWTRIASDLSKDEVEERMHIREFVLRFNYLSEAGLLKPQLEELEQINGKYSGHEGQDPASWVSDACAKAVVLMLLGLLAANEAPGFSEACENALRELRNAGFSLNKVWSTLVEWQEAIAEASGEDFAIEDPLPPSESFIAHARRSTRTMATAATNGGIAIYSSAQLIPPILSLIDLTLEMRVIHDAIDEGAKEAREVHRKAREAIKLEGERWDRVKKQHETGPKDKAGFQAARKLHKDILTALESSSEIAQCESMVRFAPLGKDPEGHIFYALAPGHSEREAAAEYADLLSSDVAPGKQMKMKRKARTLRPTEKDDMHDWSWMILVWGKKPPSAYCPVSEDDDDDDVDMEEERDEDEERWWCFSDPSDIRDLAEWVTLAYDLNTEEAVTGEQAALKQMVTSLKDFAGLLEWRLREDRYQLPAAEAKNGKK